jgi:hypothetical protein
VRRQVRHQSETHGAEQPIENGPVEGQIEDVKPDVVAEFRVGDAKGTTV